MSGAALDVIGTAGEVTGTKRRFASRRFRVDLSTTPGRLRLLLVVLILLSLAWGALAAFTVNRHASAASSVVAVREPLSIDAQQIYQHVSDADNTAATAPPPPTTQYAD